MWPDVWRDIAHAELPCNFVQIMENSVDPYHVEWLHGRYGSFLKELAGEPPMQVVTKKHVKVAFEVFEHGILKRRVLEGQTEQDEDWKTGHPLVFPGMLRVGGGGIATFQIRVPVDDTHTWHVWYQTYRFDAPAPPQAAIPVYRVPLHDEHGEWLRDYVDGQDICAWVTQGAIADRTREHLGRSDLGVIMLRKLYFEQMERVEAGQDPICTYRDPDRNVCIELPMEREKFGGARAFREIWLHGELDPLQPDPGRGPRSVRRRGRDPLPGLRCQPGQWRGVRAGVLGRRRPQLPLLVPRLRAAVHGGYQRPPGQPRAGTLNLLWPCALPTIPLRADQMG